MKFIQSCLKCTSPTMLAVLLLGGLFIFDGWCQVSSRAHASDALRVSGVYTLPAHLNIDVDYAELIYTDLDNDISYYVVTQDLPVHKGDKVHLSDGTEYVVQDVDLRGFYLKDTESSTVAGYSGSPVWHNDEIIGHISSLQGDNIVYCPWDIAG